MRATHRLNRNCETIPSLINGRLDSDRQPALSAQFTSIRYSVIVRPRRPLHWCSSIRTNAGHALGQDTIGWEIGRDSSATPEPIVALNSVSTSRILMLPKGRASRARLANATRYWRIRVLIGILSELHLELTRGWASHCPELWSTLMSGSTATPTRVAISPSMARASSSFPRVPSKCCCTIHRFSA